MVLTPFYPKIGLATNPTHIGCFPLISKPFNGYNSLKPIFGSQDVTKNHFLGGN
jgi:hypothetical protein